MVASPRRVAVYYKTSVSLDTESIRAISQEITELLSRLYNYTTFSRDLKYLKSQGITQKTLSGLLSISKRSIQYWRKGEVTPQNLYGFFMVREMAKRLREKERAQREAGLTPHVITNAP